MAGPIDVSKACDLAYRMIAAAQDEGLSDESIIYALAMAQGYAFRQLYREDEDGRRALVKLLEVSAAAARMPHGEWLGPMQ